MTVVRTVKSHPPPINKWRFFGSIGFDPSRGHGQGVMIEHHPGMTFTNAASSIIDLDSDAFVNDMVVSDLIGPI